MSKGWVGANKKICGGGGGEEEEKRNANKSKQASVYVCERE